MRRHRFQVVLFVGTTLAWFSQPSLAPAVDFESFEFNDANGTQLANAANTANPGNNWFVDPQMAPSQVQTGLEGRPGSYYIIKTATASNNNFLQIADVTSGTRYLTAKLSGWSFFEEPEEQFRLAFLNSDTEPNFGNLITAQMSLVRDANGDVLLTGGALGPGSAPVANTATFPADHPGSFEMTIELNKTANKFKVFYRDGAGPSQVLGTGLVDPARDGTALRMQATGNFGNFNTFFPSELIDFLAVDRIALTDVNPHTDLITLDVDRDNGAMILRNTSGAAISGIESYTISSAIGGLNPAGWAPIAGGANTSSNEQLMQTFAGGTSLTNGQVVPLSTVMGAWFKSPFEDVEMVLNLTGGVTRTVNVNFIDNDGLRFMPGDFNFDNAITVADYQILINNAETNLSGLSIAQAYQKGDLDRDLANSIRDFVAFKDLYEAANGGGSFAAMLAAIPEPNTALMAGLAAALLAVGRRRRAVAIRGSSATALPESTDVPEQLGDSIMRRPGHRTLGILFLAALASAGARDSSAAILEDFTFSEPDGTLLGDAENSANPGNSWVVHANTVESAVLDNKFRIQKQSATALAANFLDIDNITNSKAWLVAEIAGWNFTTTSTNEDVRFTFLDNDGPPFGSTITAQMRIFRSGDALALEGTALPVGSSTNIGPTYPLPLVQNNPFTMVLELDKTVDQYSVYYKDGSNPFALLGTAQNASARNGNSIRFGFTGTFGDTGEFFDVDRIYLTDENPITDPVDPVTLSLIVNTSSRDVFIKNETDTPISFDSYRIASQSNSLNFSQWESLSDRVPALDPFQGGDDPGEIWTKAAGSSDGVLAESFLLSSSTLNPDASLFLGKAFKMGGAEDLLFQYHDMFTDAVVSVEPTYVTTTGIPGDFNGNGAVENADLTLLLNNWGNAVPPTPAGWIGQPLTAPAVDNDELTALLNNWGTVLGGGSLAATAVPEPSTWLLTIAAAAMLAAASRRR